MSTFGTKRTVAPSAASHLTRQIGAGVADKAAARAVGLAAIANAFANATGKRIRELPLTRDPVKAALG